MATQTFFSWERENVPGLLHSGGSVRMDTHNRLIQDPVRQAHTKELEAWCQRTFAAEERK